MKYAHQRSIGRALSIIVIFGAGALGTAPLPAGAVAGTPTRISGESPVPDGPTDTCSPLAGPAGVRNYEYSPSMAVDPSDANHLVTAWVQDFRDAVGVSVSRDGGASWRQVEPPGLLACAAGPTGDYSAIDPHVAIGADGAVYAVTVLQNAAGANAAIAFTSSRDGGSTWPDEPLVHLDDAQPGAYSLEWSAVAADPRRPGVAYAAWDRHYGVESAVGGDLSGGDQYVVRTTDWGEHWSPVPLAAPAGSVWSVGTLAVLRDGTLLDAFSESGGGAAVPGATTPNGDVRVARLPLGSASWSLAPTPIGSGQLPFGDIAVGRDAVYVAAYSSSVNGGGGAWIARSSDGGRTFAPPRPFTEASALMTLSLAVTGDGHLGVLYDDDVNGMYEVRFTTSADSGASYAASQRLAGPFDPNWLPIVGSAENGGIGSYQTLRALPGGAFAAAITYVNPPADQATYGPTDIAFVRP